MNWFWQLVACAALIAGALHFWWQKRFKQAAQRAQSEKQTLMAEHERATLQFRTQQDTLLNSMAEGLLLLNPSGKIELANNAATSLLEFSAAPVGKTMLEATRITELSEMVQKLATHDEVVSQHLKLPGQAGRWLQVNGAPIRNGTGARHGTLLVFHDLTPLKRFERVREEFVANVSHELRTPLSLIKGYVETLLNGAKDDPEVNDKFLRIIERNAERLRLLIEDLLTISELESGQVKLNLQPVPLRSIVEKLFGDLRTRADAKRVTLLNQVPVLTVMADMDRIEQVLANLIDNALKYGRPQGTIIVGARQVEGEQIETFVQDDGPGIRAEAIERLFERFYRADKARSREQGGTGLGLSIVKHIVQNHKGTVRAISEPGKGTSFLFTLPKA